MEDLSFCTWKEVKYIIEGILKGEKYFSQVFEWVKDTYSKDKMVDGENWHKFEQI